jgi:hypothetical protein
LMPSSFGRTCVSIISCMAFRSSIICSIFVEWHYNNQDEMQFPIRPFLTPDITCMGDSTWGLEW